MKVERKKWINESRWSVHTCFSQYFTALGCLHCHNVVLWILALVVWATTASFHSEGVRINSRYFSGETAYVSEFREASCLSFYFFKTDFGEGKQQLMLVSYVDRNTFHFIAFYII